MLAIPVTGKSMPAKSFDKLLRKKILKLNKEHKVKNGDLIGLRVPQIGSNVDKIQISLPTIKKLPNKKILKV